VITHLLRVRSWQWLLTGLVIGGVGALSVGMWGEPLLSGYGESINGRREFEEALTRREAGRPWFTDLVVHAEKLGGDAGDGGGQRTVHVVTGMYYDGRLSTPGEAHAVWRTAFYVAEVPYRPATNLSHLPGGGGEAAKRFASLPQPTVIDFLHVMSRAQGVRFTHAWWRSRVNARVAWLLGGAVGIGVAWPITLNLIVYGSIRRPKEQRIDLRLVSTGTSDAPVPDVDAERAAAMEQLDSVINDLLQSSTAGSPVPPSRAEPPSAEPSVRALATHAFAPVAAGPASEQKAFGVAEEDFYPTEIRAPKRKSEGRER
jgi:hypothetical protein